MLPNSYKVLLVFLTVFYTSITALILELGSISVSQAQAETKSSEIRDLIITLDQRMKDHPPFSIGFRFFTPLLEDEVNWSIPFSDRELSIERWIGEVGTDYLCFYEVAGQAQIVRCTPFSNIAAITYLNGP